MNKNKIIIKIDNLKLAKQISRIIFKNIPMKGKVVDSKKKYTRNPKHRNIPE